MAEYATTPQLVITDTFTTLVSDFNTVSSGLGATGDLTTNVKTTIVGAINELEVGIRGTSNNLVATDLTTSANDLVGAINEIEGVFDASAKGISAGSDAFDIASGAFSVDASGAITLDATGDIVLKDAGVVFSTLENSGGNLILKSGTTTALTFTGANIVSAGTFETGGTTTVGGELILGNETITRTGDLTVDVSGDIKLNADDADILLQDASATYGGFTNSSGDLIIKSGTSTLLTGSGENGTFNNNLTVENVLTVTDDIIVGGTVDGRDLVIDGTKLDGIETGATADQTASEIRTLVDSATNSNVFTDADHTKLDGIETGATADQTASEILTAIKTVDGTGTGLDADLLDGVEGSSYLRSDADDTYTGDLTLTGTIALSSHLDMPDNASIKLGTGDDLVILHDATHSIIKGDSIRIKSNSVDETMASFTKDGEVNLYHNNISRLATTATGVSIPQNLELGASSLISGGGNTAITLSNANVTVNGTLSVGSLDTSNQTIRVAINELHTEVTAATASINQINSDGASANNTIIGTLTDLNTSTQTNIVAAINEIEDVFDASTHEISASGEQFDITSAAFNLTASGDVTIDGATDIILDAGGGDVFLKDDGVAYGSLTKSAAGGGSNLIIKSGTTTALTFSGANVVPSGTIDGRDIAADGSTLDANTTKLSGIADSADVTLNKISAGTNINISGSGVISSTDTNTEYSTATSDTLGLVKIGYSENGQNYPVELSSGKMFVNVPWNSDTNTQNTYSTSVVSSSGIKLRLTGAGHDGATTDDVKFVGAGSSTVSTPDESTITITSTDTNTQLSNEQVQDIVGGMLGGTETGITVTYQDGTGDIDFVVATQTDNNFTTALKNKLDGIESNLNAFVEPSQALTTTATTVADAINELKAAIPLVFNASGTQLN